MTASERYLAGLCKRSFLSLWSYPNPFRDQGRQGSGDGKELCDLLVVCGNTVIIFSDKRIAFNAKTDIDLAWRRWHRRAIEESVTAVHGAERFLRLAPDRLFTDRPCTKPLFHEPIDPLKLVVHRVVVANGAGPACAKTFNTQRGSLRVTSDSLAGAKLKGSDFARFTISDVDPLRPFVHVLDEASLDIVLSELDTIRDFCDYLSAKEILFRSGKLVRVCGEEDLLGYYIHERHRVPTLAFREFDKHSDVAIPEGYWDVLVSSDQWRMRKQLDKRSYAWDRIIEEFSRNLREGTLRGGRSAMESEWVLRECASTTRFERRMLSNNLHGVCDDARALGKPQARFFLKSPLEGIYPVYLSYPDLPTFRPEDQNEIRKFVLEVHMRAVAIRIPSAKYILGVLTQGPLDGMKSHALGMLKQQVWSQRDREMTALACKEFGAMNEADMIPHHEGTREFPMMPEQAVNPVSGLLRVGPNQACPCGSGKKFKKCHLRFFR